MRGSSEEVPTPEQQRELNARIQAAKETVKDALRPFNNKFRGLLVNAALNDLDIEFPAGYSASWAVKNN